MTHTAIIGIGQTNVSEAWDTSLRHLAWYAIEAALDDAKLSQREIDAVYVGNMLAGRGSNQRHLGALIADFSGMRGTEAIVVESAEASGAAALRQAIFAVSSGQIDTALVVGVEKASDTTGNDFEAALATSLDVEYEQAHGLTTAAQAALLMQRYMHEYGVELGAFAKFSENAHANGAKNPLAMYRNVLKPGRFEIAPTVAPPVSLFDAAPAGDGGACVIVTRTDRAMEMAAEPILIRASATATDTLALHDRRDMLWLQAAALSSQAAFAQAGLAHADIDLFELHDGYTILAAMSLEAAGFAERGAGTTWDGTMPLSSFGGLKARGNPLGATGVYQAVEAARQLRGQAADCQIENVRTVMTQNLGGLAATAITHVFSLV